MVQKEALLPSLTVAGREPGVIISLANLCEYPQAEGIMLNLFTHDLSKMSVARQRVVRWLRVPGMGAWVRRDGPQGGTSPSRQQ